MAGPHSQCVAARDLLRTANSPQAMAGDFDKGWTGASPIRRAASGFARLARPVALVALGMLVVAGVFGPAVAQAPATGTSAAPAAAPAAAAAVAKIPNEMCLACHGTQGFAVKASNGQMRSLFVNQDKFQHSVHGGRMCVDCHTNITQVPHAPVQIQVSCVNCHESLWANAQKEGKTKEFATLGFVASQIDKFMNSIHAHPSRADQSRTNATCYNCHDAHYVYPPGTPVWSAWRLNLPNTCGNCHTPELALYKTSIHGRLVLQDHDPKAATCADCHTAHQIANPVLTSTKLVITQNCGSCHEEQLQTYLATYHGQVERLGYGYTAKCFDCHGYHTVQLVNDPRSTVYPANRLDTCRKCHANATPGFLTFQPHGNAHDIKRYPWLWLTQHFMTALLAGVFAFFWTHSALWFYRWSKEHKAREREAGAEQQAAYYDIWSFRPERRIAHQGEQVWFQRFPLAWRIAHLVFLLTTMTLVLTGVTALYAASFWAPVVARLFGGPQALAIIHHACAALFLTVFGVHVVVMAVRLVLRRRPFRWFGPDSLVVRWQDFRDILAMFEWFFGLGPRPVFDRWTYWEKFDYWAVFWGVAIIGGSGATLYFRVAVANVLPGWVLNVATILHGEEAILAAVFLFTVHFFNNHFRPDKFPLDTVMFTGAMTLEELKREHAVQYERLVESGELERYRVPPPSPAMARGSRILGFTLIAIGLTLLTLVMIGFMGHALAS